MRAEDDSGSAKVFDPVAFVEWWLEHKWAEKRPRELARYLEALERKERKCRTE